MSETTDPDCRQIVSRTFRFSTAGYHLVSEYYFSANGLLAVAHQAIPADDYDRHYKLEGPRNGE